MRRLLLALLLALAALPAVTHGSQAPLPVVLVVVESPGETLDAKRRAAAAAAIADALTWWAALGPRPLAWELADERTIIVADPFDGAGWIGPHLTYQGEQLEIYLVANEAGHQGLLGGQYAGFALPAYRAAAVTSWSAGGLTANLAHELGHVLYGLPDLYELGRGCLEVDIMCEPATAYGQGWIGCRSLAALGVGCHRVWLPGVASQGARG